MRTVKDCRDELLDIEVLIEEKRAEIKTSLEIITKLKGVRSGIIWTLSNKKKEKKDVIFRSKP